MRTIATHSLKGGVGKTTTATTLAALFAAAGVPGVLVVDLDPQAHASITLGAERASVTPTHSAYGVLRGLTPAADAIRPAVAPGVDLLPGHAALATLDVEMAAEYGRELRLRDALAPVAARYAVCLVDLGAARGVAWANAVVLADALAVPTHVDAAAVDGVVQIVTAARQLAGLLKRELPVAAVIPTAVQAVGRTRGSRAVEAALRQHFGDLVTEAVPYAPRAADAFGRGLPLPMHAPDSPATAAYRRIADGLAERLALAPAAAGV